jgi:hypothetical protein
MWICAASIGKTCRCPNRFLPFATADADTFFVDIEDANLRVMYFQYVEGDYLSHFQDGEMDLVNPTLEGFMESFIEEDSSDENED